MPIRFVFTALVALSAAPLSAQTVLSGDHSITGNLCVGQDCTGSEVFGTNTLKLKALKSDILIDDTSTSPGLPANDWQLQFNDPDAGFDSYFAVRDVTQDRTVFRIDDWARENALYIADNGRIGFGTALPETELHIKSILAPSIRFEQDGTSFDPYSWLIGGWHLDFVISDKVALTEPFRIAAGAPTDALQVLGSGNVAIGATTGGGTDDGALNVNRSDGTAQVKVSESAASTAPRTLMNLQNNGRPEIVLGNTATGGEWSFGAGTNFVLKQGAVGTASSAKTNLFVIGASGDATLAGTLTTGGTTCGGGCDAVFTDQAIIPAADYAARMWAQGYLPHVGPTPEGAPLNVSEKLGGMLNALEHAHVFIDAQSAEITRLEAQLEELRRGQAAMAARLERLDGN